MNGFARSIVTIAAAMALAAATVATSIEPLRAASPRNPLQRYRARPVTQPAIQVSWGTAPWQVMITWAAQACDARDDAPARAR